MSPRAPEPSPFGAAALALAGPDKTSVARSPAPSARAGPSRSARSNPFAVLAASLAPLLPRVGEPPSAPPARASTRPAPPLPTPAGAESPAASLNDAITAGSLARQAGARAERGEGTHAEAAAAYREAARVYLATRSSAGPTRAAWNEAQAAHHDALAAGRPDRAARRALWETFTSVDTSDRDAYLAAKRAIWQFDRDHPEVLAAIEAERPELRRSFPGGGLEGWVPESARTDEGGSHAGLGREAAKTAMAVFKSGKALGVKQLEFVNLIVDHLADHGAMDPGLLYEWPFTDWSAKGPDGLFPSAQVDELVTVLERLRAAAASPVADPPAPGPDEARAKPRVAQKLSNVEKVIRAAAGEARTVAYIAEQTGLSIGTVNKLCVKLSRRSGPTGLVTVWGPGDESARYRSDRDAEAAPSTVVVPRPTPTAETDTHRTRLLAYLTRVGEATMGAILEDVGGKVTVLGDPADQVVVERRRLGEELARLLKETLVRDRYDAGLGQAVYRLPRTEDAAADLRAKADRARVLTPEEAASATRPAAAQTGAESPTATLGDAVAPLTLEARIAQAYLRRTGNWLLDPRGVEPPFMSLRDLCEDLGVPEATVRSLDGHVVAYLGNTPGRPLGITIYSAEKARGRNVEHEVVLHVAFGSLWLDHRPFRPGSGQRPHLSAPRPPAAQAGAESPRDEGADRTKILAYLDGRRDGAPSRVITHEVAGSGASEEARADVRTVLRLMTEEGILDRRFAVDGERPELGPHRWYTLRSALQPSRDADPAPLASAPAAGKKAELKRRIATAAPAPASSFAVAAASLSRLVPSAAPARSLASVRAPSERLAPAVPAPGGGREGWEPGAPGSGGRAAEAGAAAARAAEAARQGTGSPGAAAGTWRAAAEAYRASRTPTGDRRAAESEHQADLWENFRVRGDDRQFVGREACAACGATGWGGGSASSDCAACRGFGYTVDGAAPAGEGTHHLLARRRQENR
jgi:hypothetical protein